jgi:hypothetical protein
MSHPQHAFIPVLAGQALMKVLGRNDLVRRTPPRIEKFHSYENVTNQRGITYWRKAYFEPAYCESQNAYVCQRSAAAASASEGNGELNRRFELRHVSPCHIFKEQSCL